MVSCVDQQLEHKTERFGTEFGSCTGVGAHSQDEMVSGKLYVQVFNRGYTRSIETTIVGGQNMQLCHSDVKILTYQRQTE